MKRLTKLMTLVVVALVASLAMAGAAWADDTVTNSSSSAAKGTGNFTITMQDAEAGHAFKAFRIFDGDLSEGGKLSNISWAEGVNTTGIIANLKAAGLSLEDDATAAEVATALADQSDDSDVMKKVADVFYAAKGSAVATVSEQTGTDYVLSGLTAGYYLVTDEYTGTPDEGAASLSRNILAVVGDVTAKVKNSTPTVEKKIVDNGSQVEANTANIGDSITYNLTSTVPNTAGYKEYYMDFSDTLSKGLTYDASYGVKVYVGDSTTPIDASNYTVVVGDYSATDGTSVAIHFKDMVSRSAGATPVYTTGAAIKVEYKATVNDNAVIGNDGNPNTVKLAFSNNPNNSGNGNPDDNNDGVQGETPEQTVKTYVAEIELTKVDGTDTTKKLAGAVFNIKGTQINKVIVTGDRFVADASGEYYLLTDNTYTQTAPNDSTKNKYAMEGESYKRFKKEAYATTSVQETANVDFQAVTDSNGVIKVTGLKEGTYTFTEIQAPEGYNLLTTPITIEVKSNIATVVSDTTGQTAFEWQKDTSATNVTVDNGTFKFNVENNGGSVLPSTGGMGTTILYIIGAVLVIGAGVYLVTRRRIAKGQNLED